MWRLWPLFGVMILVQMEPKEQMRTISISLVGQSTQPSGGRGEGGKGGSQGGSEGRGHGQMVWMLSFLHPGSHPRPSPDGLGKGLSLLRGRGLWGMRLLAQNIESWGQLTVRSREADPQ